MTDAAIMEALARQIVQDRLRQAAQAALAAQLPRAPAPPFSTFASPMRQRLATALRSLARRLDPSPAAEPCSVTLNSR